MRPPPSRTIGRYSLFDELGSGGFARVHLGRLNGDGGFARTVAIKRLHEGLAGDPEAVRLLQDEGRLAARVRHPNVVPTLDVLAAEGELWLIMEYVHGETLVRLLGSARRRGAGVPLPVLGAVLSNALSGLHAAHETVDEWGRPLGIVHRDVSPQNVMVGVDGVARVLDFGIAKANGIEARTRQGQFRGKLAYAAPEQLGGKPVGRAVDIYAAGVMLWEALAGRRLFWGSTEPELIVRVTLGQIEPPSTVNPAVPPAADEVVMRALAREPAQRYPSALEMARAVELALGVAPARDVGAWVAEEAAEALARSTALLLQVESGGLGEFRPAPPGPSASLPATELATGTSGGTSCERGSTTFAPAALPSTRPLRRISAALVALALCASAAFALSLRARPPIVAATQVEVVEVVDVAPPRAAEPRPELAAAPSAAPAARPAAPPPNVASAPPRRPPPAPARPARPARPSVEPAPVPNCSPPYVVDAGGRRRFKPECL